MATTALKYTDGALILNREVATTTSAIGMPVIGGADDDKVTVDTGGSALFLGVYMDDAIAAGSRADVQVTGVAAVKVGTGGATRWTHAYTVATGFTNAPAHDSDGTGNVTIVGQFLQSGVAGDMVGMLILKGSRGS